MSTLSMQVATIMAALEVAGITTNQSVVETADSIGLISPTQNSKSEARHFQKSYGERARKPHLRNYAPNISLQTFVEVGLSYHEYKKTWHEYKNPLSYALLGMAVLTGREPTMPNGIFTKAGNSFGRHLDTAWAEWFYSNEFTVATVPVSPIGNATQAVDLPVVDVVDVIEQSTADVVEQLENPPTEVVIDMSTLPPTEVVEPAPTAKKRGGKKAKAADPIADAA